ncbi:MAG: sulfotransferase [Balneolaceae bacterium]|nr:sulfotransferase [Balneolaceae bacterium]
MRKTLHALYLEFNKLLGITERWYAGSDDDRQLSHRPVFILGAPRCGSTLLYQAMVTAFDFSFLSNAHCLLHGAPWMVEWLLTPSTRYRASSYRSTYGSVEGWSAPSECGDFWYRFFPRKPQHVPIEHCSGNTLKNLRTSFRSLEKASGKPVLIKNLVNTLRLEPIMRAFPEALFLVLEREQKDIAHSILESRKNRAGSYEAWFSLEPPGIEQLRKKPVVEQVVGQIRASYRSIAEAEQMAPGQFYHLTYEDFCSNPERELHDIAAFFEKQDAELPLSGPVPDPFERRSEIRIDKKLYNELLQYLENQNEQH